MMVKKKKPMKALTPEQKKKLQVHAKSYSKKHVDTMTKHMKHGKSFATAHKHALKTK